jgi:hypothetical protein
MTETNNQIPNQIKPDQNLNEEITDKPPKRSPKKLISKRVLLKVAGIALSTTALGGAIFGVKSSFDEKDIGTPKIEITSVVSTENGTNAPPVGESNGEPEQSQIPQVEIPETESTISLGNEIDASLENKFNITWTPDVHISFTTNNEDNLRSFFIGGNGGKTYLLEGCATDDILTAINNAPQKNLPLVWGPKMFTDPNKYTYSEIGSVVQPTDDPNYLIAFTHNEEHAGNSLGFTASISQLKSLDGGKSWQLSQTDPVVKGDDPMPPGQDVSGAGQPCAIVKDNCVYLYCTDWSREHDLHRDEIFLARAAIDQNGNLGKFEFYQGNNKFGESEENLAPVIPFPDIENSYAALSSISYNTKINKFLCVFETDLGFQIATSDDAINWSQGKMFYSFQTPHSQLDKGGLFESYPSLLSFSEKSDDQTDDSGYLVYASGQPHNMVLRPFSIK